MSFSGSRCNCGKRKTRGSLVCDACARAEADGGDMACYLNTANGFHERRFAGMRMLERARQRHRRAAQ